MDFELQLFDRLEKIKTLNKQYDLENNAYISFSGGKDSTCLSYLVDLALPNNKIPRVYKDTGIEYPQVRNFVKSLVSKDSRFIYLKPTLKIKETLKNVGYPFKSKQHSHNFLIYKNNVEDCEKYKNEVINNNIAKRIENGIYTNEDKLFINNLPKGVKTFIKYYFGIREENEKLSISIQYALIDKLKFQFTPEYASKQNFSDKCCLMFKKGVLREYEVNSGRHDTLTGMRKAEGGNRNNLACITQGKNGKHFNVLAPVNDEFIEWFINKYNIELCELYYPPFNFKRTGCLSCPFALDLEEQMAKLKIYDKKTYDQANRLWDVVFKEYKKIDYRLKDNKQMDIWDL